LKPGACKLWVNWLQLARNPTLHEMRDGQQRGYDFVGGGPGGGEVRDARKAQHRAVAAHKLNSQANFETSFSLFSFKSRNRALSKLWVNWIQLVQPRRALPAPEERVDALIERQPLQLRLREPVVQRNKLNVKAKA
jgi:hypothetical protein